ncbi:MAG: hypothetical protein ACRCTZ_15045 [Sarcina sp.]
MDNGVLPVYEMNKGDNDGGGFMWILVLFFLFFGRDGFNGGASGLANQVSNDFMYTNLNSTLGQGFTQLTNQNFGIQKDMWNLSTSMQQCCCETNRNIDSIRAENYKNTCEITNAIHNEGEQTRALINANTMQDLRDKVSALELGLSQAAQSANIINQIKPCPIPAYPVPNPCGCKYSTAIA